MSEFISKIKRKENNKFLLQHVTNYCSGKLLTLFIQSSTEFSAEILQKDDLMIHLLTKIGEDVQKRRNLQVANHRSVLKTRSFDSFKRT